MTTEKTTVEKMAGNISQLVLNLKENNEDYEFYPTTDEMLRVIAPYMEYANESN